MDLNIRLHMVEQIIKEFRTFGLVVNKETPHRKWKEIGIADKGDQVLQLLSNNNLTSERLKVELEKTIFADAPSSEYETELASLIKHIQERQDDDDAVYSNLVALSEAIHECLKGGSVDCLSRPELQEFLVKIPRSNMSNDMKARGLGILSLIVRETRRRVPWHEKYQYLADDLRNLLKEDHQVSIDAIHVIKEFRTNHDNIPDDAYRVVVTAAEEYVLQRNNSLLAQTSAVLDVLKEWKGHLTSKQKEELAKFADQITKGKNGYTFRGKSNGIDGIRASDLKKLLLALSQNTTVSWRARSGVRIKYILVPSGW